VSSLVLLGLSWTVQLVVYPGFVEVGVETGTPDDAALWRAVHAAHARRMGLAVAGPCAAEGAGAAVLLVARPDGVPLWLVLLGDAGAALTVAVPLVWSVPAHGRLASAYDPGAQRLLLRTHALRTLRWAVAGACGTAALLLV
jgi:hypothetical protein